MDFERHLVEAIANDTADFAGAVDAFVGQLLAEVGPSGRGRPTDGVLFVREERRANGALGRGVVVMSADQTVEPLVVQFTLDGARGGLARGRVQFGCRRLGAVPFGSSAHHALARRLLGDPDAAFEWREQFVLGADGWSRLPPSEP